MQSKGLSHLGISIVCLLLLSCVCVSSATIHLKSDEEGFISVAVSEKGLVFVKDLLVNYALSSITSLKLPTIQKSLKIPFIGSVHAVLSNITISGIEVSSSEIKPGESGLVIVASGVTVNLSMNWRYSYSTWLIPVDISDKGRASVLVEDMEVGLSLGLEIQEGTLKLSLLDCGCYMKDMIINLDGGASWFYQGLVDAFEGQMRAVVENAITKKLKDGVFKLDNLLQNLPKRIPVDEIAELNVTFVNQPLFYDSSVELEINGLFTAKENVVVPKFNDNYLQLSASCGGPLKMLGISLDEAAFNSISDVYFDAGVMHWVVDKVPNQALLNTAYWKYIVPQLYKKYPNDDMKLNISVNSPPLIKLASDNVEATILSDMIIEVVDNSQVIPVACISVEAHATGFVEVLGNNLAGKAGLDSFALKLKWSKIGNFHMYLIEKTMWVFLKDVAVPYVNTRLRKGFPLPVIHGFFLQDADILCRNSRILVCSDVAFTESHAFRPIL